ncbi:MAG: DUF4231 domain-containing protein [Acidimicrobiales bacterium]
MVGTAEPQAEANRVLDHVWERQRGWSIGADLAKAQVERARIGNLLLIVGAAVFGALAAQSDWLPSGFQRGLSLAASVLLMVAGFVQSHYLTALKVKAWTAARSASETLKALVYVYMAGVSVDTSSDNSHEESQVDAALLDQLTMVESRAFVLGANRADPDNKPLPTVASVPDYRANRTEEQAQWHSTRRGEHDRRARLLRAAQLGLTVLGSVLALIAGVSAQPGIDSWVAAVAAMGAAVAAHLGATQYDRIAQSYEVTATLLEREVVRFDSLQQRSATAVDEGAGLIGGNAGQTLVRNTEEILARQNDGWIDLIQKATEPN